MKAKIVITTFTMVALTLSLAVAAEARSRHGKGRGDGIEKIMRHVDLTGDQREQLEELQREHRTEMKPLKQEMRTRRQQMREYWTAETIDEGAIWALDAEMAPLRQQIHQMRLGHRLQVMAVLTPEQRAELHDSMEKKFRQKRFKNK